MGGLASFFTHQSGEEPKCGLVKHHPAGEAMKRFIIEQSSADIISHSGLSLIGQAIKRYTHLSGQLDASVPMRHGIKHSDVIKSYLALLSIGKNDFEAINGILKFHRFHRTSSEKV